MFRAEPQRYLDTGIRAEAAAERAGNNQIVVQVTNLWVNRLIGDQQPWALKKYTFADFTPYKADSPLLPSGLLGPVRLLSVSAP